MVKKECLEGHYVENLVARTSAAAEIYKRALLFFQIKYSQKTQHGQILNRRCFCRRKYTKKGPQKHALRGS